MKNSYKQIALDLFKFVRSGYGLSNVKTKNRRRQRANVISNEDKLPNSLLFVFIIH